MLDMTKFAGMVQAPSVTPPPTTNRLADKQDITCPTLLQGEARKEWRRIVKEMQRLGFLDAVDRALLVQYCVLWADYLEAIAAVRTQGVGTPQHMSPAYWVRCNCEKRLITLAGELGLSPNARVRIMKSLKVEEGNAPPPVMSRPSFN